MQGKYKKGLYKKKIRRKGRFRSVSAIVPDILSVSARRRGFVEANILTNWKKVCPEYYKHSRPRHLRRGLLTIAVNSSSAMANMQMWIPTLKDRINTFYGYEIVENIRFQVEAFKKEEETLTTIIKPTEQAVSRAENMCDMVSCVDLKQALVKLGARVFASKKEPKKG